MKRFVIRPLVFLSVVLMLSLTAGCSTTSPAGSDTKPGSDTVKPPASTPKPASPDQSVAESIAMTELSAVRIIDPSSGWVGGNGWIARSDDGGKQWKVQLQNKTKVEQIFALNGTDAWGIVDAAADSSKRELLQTTDGGMNWSKVGPLPNTGFVHFVNKNEGFSANAYTTDGGKNWSKFEIPDHTVGDAYFHDKNNGWAVTAEDKKILVKRTTDGGKKWSAVLSRDTEAFLNNAIIRSAGPDDAWVEMIGDSGMSQTSYSLFHTADGGRNWQPVLANSTAGAGPAPGFPADYKGIKNTGSKPGELYVVSPQVAFMGGYCPACDNPNSVGSTTDGGKTWINGKEQVPGSSGAMLAISDAKNGWWITKDAVKPSVLYATSDGGQHWNPVHTFDQPKKQ